MKKSLCHYCASGIVYRRLHSYVNDVVIECQALKKIMPPDVIECTYFRDRFVTDYYGRNSSDGGANQAINAGEGILLDLRKKPEQYL